MLQNLGAPPDALVVMDAGIATEANIQGLRKMGYGYRVVSRERSRQFNADDAISLETAARETVRCQRVLAEDGQEVRVSGCEETRKTGGRRRRKQTEYSGQQKGAY